MFVGSVLAITWTHAVLSYRVNCCRRPVFEKKSGFNITINRRRLAGAAAPPPLVAGSANSIFFTTSTSATCQRRFADVPTRTDVANFRCRMCTSAEP